MNVFKKAMLKCNTRRKALFLMTSFTNVISNETSPLKTFKLCKEILYENEQMPVYFCIFKKKKELKGPSIDFAYKNA